jgi:histidinol-phosphate aminotransferase
MSDYDITPLVRSLPATVPFVGPEAQEREQGRPFIARIGANENVFGPSPSVIEMISRIAGESWMYGDPEIHELRHAIAEYHEVGAENILIGEGIDGLLGYVVRMFIEPGDKVVTSAGAYPTFNYHVVGHGGCLEFVPYRDDHEDPEGLLESASTHNAKLFYLANPDNPMGTWWNADVVDSLIQRVPKGTLLLLDEAYGEFAPPGVLSSIDTSDPRVLRFRTFSKAYGLAGIRIGYVLGERGLIREFNKVRNHFGVGRVAQAAALAALSDRMYLQQVITQVADGRNRIAGIASDHGLASIPSAANFVAIDCGQDGPYAISVLDDLARQGVFVRMPGVAPLNRCIRVTVSLDQHLDAFAEALPGALAAAKSAS